MTSRFPIRFNHFSRTLVLESERLLANHIEICMIFHLKCRSCSFSPDPCLLSIAKILSPWNIGEFAKIVLTGDELFREFVNYSRFDKCLAWFFFFTASLSKSHWHVNGWTGELPTWTTRLIDAYSSPFCLHLKKISSVSILSSSIIAFTTVFFPYHSWYVLSTN